MRLRSIFTAAILFSLMIVIGTGCSLTQPLPQSTPTLIPATNVPSPTQVLPTPSQTATAIPSTATPAPLVASTDTPLPPSQTPLPTETPGPFEHEVKDGETLGFIVQQYGHRSFDVFSEVVRLNESMFNADILPPPGNILLIPRPTAEILTQPVTTNGAPNPNPQQERSLTTQVGGLLQTIHIVQDGESIIDIAQQYSTTLEIISQLNSNIPFFGCDFNIPSGGPDCIIIINIGQEVIVPAPTPTPTLSPTPSGNETATPTPTYMAPIVVFPPDGGTARAGTFRLQWVSAGVLQPDEAYLVYLKDVTAQTSVNAFTTRSTTFTVPADLIPRDGQTHEFQWWVTVGKPNLDGIYGNVSGEAKIHTFFWESAE